MRTVGDWSADQGCGLATMMFTVPWPVRRSNTQSMQYPIKQQVILGRASYTFLPLL